MRYHCVTGVQTCALPISLDGVQLSVFPVLRWTWLHFNAAMRNIHAQEPPLTDTTLPRTAHAGAPVCAVRGRVVSVNGGSCAWMFRIDRKSTRLNSSHTVISYA